MTHVTCHVTTTTTKMADDKDDDAFMLLYFLTAKQHKVNCMGSPLVTRQVTGRAFVLGLTGLRISVRNCMY